METHCRHFNGYKPCGLSLNCNPQCSQREIVTTSVLIVHLGAMGAVLRSTALLPAILRKYPKAQITWVTESPMPPLLRSHPDVHQVLSTDPQDLLALKAREFDVALVIDKSAKAAGVLASTKAREVFGFILDPQLGFSRPATRAAEELWRLGLSDHDKFFVNRKSENQLVHEALELGPYRGDEYELYLTAPEQQEVKSRRLRWTTETGVPLIGLNTGCGPLMPAKKWSVEFHRQVIGSLIRRGYKNLVLLGGPDDRERNEAIAQDLPVTLSPTQQGIRDGAVSVAACDLVLTGDSYGMHLAIALKKFVVAWFGPSCAHEIELYGRGEKLQAEVACSPCWKRSCQKSVMCYDRVSADDIERAVDRGAGLWRASHGDQISDVPLTKPHVNLGL